MVNVPPEGIPYGKPSPGRNPMAELHQGGGGQYNMVKFPLYGKSLPPPPHKFHDKGTNTLGDCPRRNYTIWQTFPMKEYHIYLYNGKPSPGRNPVAEFPQGK